MSEIDIYAGNTMSYADYYIEHFGVKGMKWGVRKKRPLDQHGVSPHNLNYGRKYGDADIRAARKRVNPQYKQMHKELNSNYKEADKLMRHKATRDKGRAMVAKLDKMENDRLNKIYNSTDGKVARLKTSRQKRAKLFVVSALAGPLAMKYAYNKIEKNDAKRNPIVKQR